MFDYIQNIRSHHTVPCTAEILHTVMRSTIVGMTCAEIADCHEQMLRGEMSREDFETKKSKLKRRLPAFCFHAHFKNGRRLNNEAVPSGLSILDIDHIKGSPEVFFNEKVKGKAKELGIVLAHKTPSGEGLRLVFVIPQGMGLVEGQQWLAQQIGLSEFDEACKDLARCSFAVPEEYVLFLDEEELFKAIEPIDTIDSIDAIDSIETIGAASNKSLKVFDLCREQAGLKDVDINARGSRHNSLLAILSVGAARLLSEAEAMAVVAQRMPDFFKEPDCRQLIHDFYAKYHDDSKMMSATVQRINARAEQLAQRAKEKEMGKENEEEEEDGEDSSDSGDSNYRDYRNYSNYRDYAIPPIPGLKQSLTGVPEQMRMPALCALLPMAASSATATAVSSGSD